MFLIIIEGFCRGQITTNHEIKGSQTGVFGGKSHRPHVLRRKGDHLCI